VRLVAEISEAPSGVFKPPGIDATEFLRGLDFFGVNLTEEQRRRVITGLTDQDAKQRNRLRRRWTPGYEEEAMRGISRHIETRASTIGKEEIRPELMHLFNPSSESQLALWDGDYDGMLRAQQKYEQLKARTSDPMALAHAKQKYDRARFMYEKSSGRAWTYKNRANALLTYFNDNQDLNTSDKEMGEVISRLRTWTSVAMLGGSIATGALNYLAVPTNVLPFLGSYNSRSGFGGGFGYMRSSKEFFRALNQVGLIKAVGGSPKSALRMGDAEKDMNTAVFWKTVAKDKARLAKMKITKDEAEFLAEEIEVGAMIPAQTNAMMYTSRGIGGFGKLDGIIEGYMSTFNLSEQATRRAVGLAAYRMHRDRSAATAVLEGGKTDQDGKLHKDNVDDWNKAPDVERGRGIPPLHVQGVPLHFYPNVRPHGTQGAATHASFFVDIIWPPGIPVRRGYRRPTRYSVTYTWVRYRQRARRGGSNCRGYPPGFITHHNARDSQPDDRR